MEDRRRPLDTRFKAKDGRHLGSFESFLLHVYFDCGSGAPEVIAAWNRFHLVLSVDYSIADGFHPGST